MLFSFRVCILAIAAIPFQALVVDHCRMPLQGLLLLVAICTPSNSMSSEPRLQSKYVGGETAMMRSH